MLPIHQVKSFADEWHSGKWRARDLPDAIGAEVLWEPGGRKVLGFSMVLPGLAEINLNERIRGTPLEAAVIYHECTHVLLRDLVGFCGNEWAERQSERNATYGSAILAIPAADAVAFVQHRATVHELAEAYGVPTSLVYMRGALAVLLDEVEGERSRARASLGSARRSLDNWMTAVARTI